MLSCQHKSQLPEGGKECLFERREVARSLIRLVWSERLQEASAQSCQMRGRDWTFDDVKDDYTDTPLLSGQLQDRALGAWV